MIYDYRTFTQTSRPYEYGEGKEFKDRNDCLEKVEQIKEKIGTELALKKIYELSEINVIEVLGALQIVVEVKVPIVVEEQEE